eukprot:2532080-Rhodomonas_salina.1
MLASSGHASRCSYARHAGRFGRQTGVLAAAEVRNCGCWGEKERCGAAGSDQHERPKTDARVDDAGEVLQLQCDAAQIRRVGSSGVLSCRPLRGSLGCGGRGLWLEGRCGSTLAEISERNGSNRAVRGAVIRMGEYCQAVSASLNRGRLKSGTELVNDGSVIGLLVSVWSERR